jgi:hypothetical protein
VIGAGAGFDIGMPLGDKLSTIIASKLNIKFGQGGFKQESGDQEIMQALQVMSPASAWFSSQRAGLIIPKSYLRLFIAIQMKL